MFYFLFPKKAKTLEGKESSQTEMVTAIENAAIKGYDRINNISNAMFPAVIGLLRLVILLN
jgi:hypothetical protein